MGKLPLVAQLDRVPDSDSDGRRFESCRAGHSLTGKRAERSARFFVLPVINSLVEKIVHKLLTSADFLWKIQASNISDMTLTQLQAQHQAQNMSLKLSLMLSLKRVHTL